VTAFNFGSDPAVVTVDMLVDSKTSSKNINVPTGQPAEALFPLDLPMDAPHYGFFESTADAVSADNRKYFVLNKLPEIPVLVVCGKSEAADAFFLMKALSPLGLKTRFKTKYIQASTAGKEKLSDYAVVMLVNTGNFDKGFRNDLINSVKNGIGLAVFPGELSGSGFNSALSDLLPMEIAGQVSAPAEKRFGTGLMINAPDSELMKGISDPKFCDWASVNIKKYINVAKTKVRTPITFDDGSPALVEGDFGNGRALFFASALDGEWSNFPLTPVFLPFIHKVIEYLAGNIRENTEYSAGDAFISSGNAKYAPVIKGGITTGRADIPGVYKVTEGKREFYAAVNVKASEEGNLLFADKVDIEMKLNNPANKFAGEKNRFIYWSKKEAEDKQRFWWYLAVLALLASTFEIIVANYGKTT